MQNYKKFEIKHSIKNIPNAKNEEYKEKLIEKTQHLVRRMRWKAKFFEDENNVATEEHDNYGFKTTRLPKPVDNLKAFEEDLINMVKNVEFKTNRSRFQSELIKTVRDIFNKP